MSALTEGDLLVAVFAVVGTFAFVAAWLWFFAR